MRFTSTTVAAFCLTVGSVVAFSPASPAFVPAYVVNARSSGVQKGSSSSTHGAGCACASCSSVHTPGCACSACLSAHSAVCACAACRGGSSTRLFMSEPEAAAEEVAAEVPAQVASMDGIESEDEAHNADRPARASLKKKSPSKGKALSEFEIGSTVSAKVKTLTSYGAFLDIGASTDGLLHISNLSTGFCSDVKEFLTDGQEIEVRIMNIDEAKNQIGLTLLTAEEEEAAKQPRQQSRGGGGGGGRRDDSAVVSALAGKGFDSAQFIEGTVASTVDFGAFVRFDASKLNSEVEGEMDGLVHISALTAGRADSVTAICNTGDKVQVRVMQIDGRKVSLSMISVEAEQEAKERRRSSGPEPVQMGAKDWKESLDRIAGDGPTFSNSPMVLDLSK